jgi:hypothetical protein
VKFLFQQLNNCSTGNPLCLQSLVQAENRINKQTASQLFFGYATIQAEKKRTK